MYKTTNFIFCRFSDVNDKMVFLTLKCFFAKKNHPLRFYNKVINVIIIIEKLHLQFPINFNIKLS